jgi:hypothetical protein
MKKLLTLLIGVLLCGNLLAPARDELIILAPEPISPYEVLWQAVCMVESSGNQYAVNVTEKAYGVSQIRQVRLDDYAKRTGIRYTLIDCFDKNISKSIWLHYALESEDLEYIARCWNGGPGGMRIKMTEDYWRKVKLHL